MANTRTITAANAILMLAVPGLYNTPRRIQGFTADNITEIDDLTLGEGQMGVDGHLSRGYVINAVNQTIAIKADSESIDFFENLIESSRQQREAYVINGSILLRAVGKRVVMENGVLISASTMPAIGKTLGDRRFRFMWEKVTTSPN